MTTMATTTQERLRLPGSTPAEPTVTSGLSPADIFRIIVRNLVAIIFIAMLFSAAAVGIWLLMWFKFPTYTSEALVQCISDNPRDPLSLTEAASPKDEFERFVESQARIIKSPEILDLALQTPEVQATSWYKETEPNLRRIELEDTLGASYVRGTNYVQVRMKCRDIRDPRVIVEQVVRAYMERVREAAVSEYEQELRTKRSEKEDLEGRLASKIQSNREYAAQNLSPGALQGGPNPLLEQIRIQAEQVATLQSQLDELQPIYDLYNNPSREADFGNEMLEVEADPRIAALANQRLQIEQLMTQTQERFGKNHREYKSLETQLNSVDKTLAQYREEKLNEVLTGKRDQVVSAYRNLQQILLSARQQYDNYQATQRDLDRALAIYLNEQDQIELMQDRLARLEDNIIELERVVRQKSAVRIELAQRAVDPIERSAPTLLMLPAGVILACLLAVGLVVTFNLLDSKVRTPADIVRHLSIPMLGTIPDIDDEEVPIETVETAVRDNPNSLVAEAFRSIRTNLLFSSPADRQRTVLVTSPQPDDGKTTVASNLAISMASSGRRVLLIDANFRRPMVHKFHAGVTNEAGLSNILITEPSLTGFIRKSSVRNLDLITAGPLPPNPAELLESRQMRSLLEQAVNHYDQIFIDAPPVLLANDAPVLATMVDGVILVCRARANSRGMALRACRQLSIVGAHVFGAVLNAVQVHRGGYFREQLRTFYDYPDALPAAGSGPALPGDDKR